MSDERGGPGETALPKTSLRVRANASKKYSLFSLNQLEII
jgi:hypothetical protein